ncbi:hypothetical protein NKH18_17425 [Streptomyces sp. M10(2022)]
MESDLAGALDELAGVQDTGRREVREARDALKEREETDTGEAAHDGWVQLVRDQLLDARAALATAERTAQDRLTTAKGASRTCAAA